MTFIILPSDHSPDLFVIWQFCFVSHFSLRWRAVMCDEVWESVSSHCVLQRAHLSRLDFLSGAFNFTHTSHVSVAAVVCCSSEPSEGTLMSPPHPHALYRCLWHVPELLVRCVCVRAHACVHACVCARVSMFCWGNKVNLKSSSVIRPSWLNKASPSETMCQLID